MKLIEQFKNAQQNIIDTMQQELESLETSEDELKGYRERLEKSKDIRDFVIDTEVNLLDTRKKLGLVLNAAKDYYDLKNAISFLTELDEA